EVVVPIDLERISRPHHRCRLSLLHDRRSPKPGPGRQPVAIVHGHVGKSVQLREVGPAPAFERTDRRRARCGRGLAQDDARPRARPRGGGGGGAGRGAPASGPPAPGAGGGGRGPAGGPGTKPGGRPRSHPPPAPPPPPALKDGKPAPPDASPPAARTRSARVR